MRFDKALKIDWKPCVEMFPTDRADRLANTTLSDPTLESTDVAAADAALMDVAKIAETDPMSALITADTDASFRIANDSAAIEPTVDAFAFALRLAEVTFDKALMMLCKPFVDTLPTERADTA